MTLVAGARLGPYEIVSLQGAGGMGEVYEAKDTRLDRTVAIKVLPEHLAESPERKARFEREARAISKLSHPNICTLHEFDTQDGIDFLVMEYLEGETLADRLSKGPLPVDQALRYAMDIVDALDKAHRQGLVHRDLKPGNVMLTKSGAKLLDFGLAKFVDAEEASALSQLPTKEKPLTDEGAVPGTLPYMAPEQLEGKEADTRTDIFAFGAVLYEMLTGRRAFEGESRASLIAAILEHEPRTLSELQPLTPLSLERVVKRCLAKDRDDRWQTARDLSEGLSWVADSGAQARNASGPDRSRWMPFAVVGLAASIVTGVAVWMARPTSPSPERPLLRVAITPSDGVALGQTVQDIDISSDGTRIVYQGPDVRLMVRAIDQLAAVPLDATIGNSAYNPFISSGSEWVGFWSEDEGTLKKVSLRGGPTFDICEVGSAIVRGASWGPDDNIIFGTNTPSGLWRVSAEGGTPEELTMLDASRGAVNHGWPHILPGGEAVLFTILPAEGSVETAQIAVLELETRDIRVLLPRGSSPQYSSRGHIVYGLDGTLWAAPFDLARLQVTGPPEPVLDGVLTKASGSADFALAEDGSLIYVSGAANVGPRTLAWVTLDGREAALAAPPRAYQDPSVSPDGTRVVFSFRDQANTDVAVWDVRRQNLTRLTFHTADDSAPLWTPDGARVVFRSERERDMGLFWKAADGTGGVERLMASDTRVVPFSWSPDRRLVFAMTDVMMLTVEGEQRGTITTVLDTEFRLWRPAVSADGQWLAYESDESGMAEIYINRFPNVDDGKWQVSTDGGEEPHWSPDGKSLYYYSPSQASLMRVSIQTNPTLTLGRPEILFSVRDYALASPTIRFGTVYRRYDLAPDGQRFLMLKPVEREAGIELIFVQNWISQLERLVPNTP